MLGLTSATLVGVPMAAWLGQHWGWRAAFVFVGAIAALACVLLRRGLPDSPAPQGASPLRELGALARPQVWLTLGIGAIGFGGLFAVFSDIKPTLTEVTGLSVHLVPLVLAAFPFTAPYPLLAALNVFLVGTIVAIAPALQIRLMDVAGDAQTLAAAFNHSAFNLANALGAWLGGLAIAAGLGWTSTGWVGVLLALAGMGVFGAALGLDRRRR